MINDPIDGMDIPSAFQTSISGNGIFSTIRLNNINSDSIWSMARWDRGDKLGVTKRYWHNGPINAEQFLDMLATDYPDHFEWLLFHPEWL